MGIHLTLKISINNMGAITMTFLKKFCTKIYPFVRETAEMSTLIRKDPLIFGLFIMTFILSVVLLIK